MNRYDRTWPIAVAAIGVGSLMGWAVFGPHSHGVESEVHFGVRHVPSVHPAPAAEPAVVKTARARAATAGRAQQVALLAQLEADRMLEVLRKGERAVDRGNAAVLLGAYPRPEHVTGALMIAMRTDASPAVRSKSAASLGRLGMRAAMGPLHLAATLDADQRVREAAVGALAAVGQAETIPMLADILSTDPSESVRAQAVRSLIAIGDKEVWDELGPLLRNERSEVVGQALQEALRPSGRR